MQKLLMFAKLFPVFQSNVKVNHHGYVLQCKKCIPDRNYFVQFQSNSPNLKFPQSVVSTKASTPDILTWFSQTNLFEKYNWEYWVQNNTVCRWQNLFTGGYTIYNQASIPLKYRKSCEALKRSQRHVFADPEWGCTELFPLLFLAFSTN